MKENYHYIAPYEANKMQREAHGSVTPNTQRMERLAVSMESANMGDIYDCEFNHKLKDVVSGMPPYYEQDLTVGEYYKLINNEL